MRISYAIDSTRTRSPHPEDQKVFGEMVSQKETPELKSNPKVRLPAKSLKRESHIALFTMPKGGTFCVFQLRRLSEDPKRSKE